MKAAMTSMVCRRPFRRRGELVVVMALGAAVQMAMGSMVVVRSAMVVAVDAGVARVIAGAVAVAAPVSAVSRLLATAPLLVEEVLAYAIVGWMMTVVGLAGSMVVVRSYPGLAAPVSPPHSEADVVTLRLPSAVMTYRAMAAMAIASW